MTNNIGKNNKIRTDQKFSVSVALIAAVAILTIGLTATTMHPQQAQASASGCPDGHVCTCDPASGVLTDHTSGFQVNDGCDGSSEPTTN